MPSATAMALTLVGGTGSLIRLMQLSSISSMLRGLYRDVVSSIVLAPFGPDDYISFRFEERIGW